MTIEISISNVLMLLKCSSNTELTTAVLEGTTADYFASFPAIGSKHFLANKDCNGTVIAIDHKEGRIQMSYKRCKWFKTEEARDANSDYNWNKTAERTFKLEYDNDTTWFTPSEFALLEEERIEPVVAVQPQFADTAY